VSLHLLERLVDSADLAAAEESGLVVAELDGARLEMRLAHPLYGDVLRAGLPASRSRYLFRRLAEMALAMPMRRRDDKLRAAVWQVDSGALTRPDLVRAGARQALDRSDLALAERLARAARDAVPDPETDRLLAEILEYRGRSAEAAAVLPDSPPPPGEGLARWAVTRAETLYWGAGETARAEQVLDLAAAGPGADLTEGSRSWLLLFDGRCAESLAVARGVLDSADAGAQGLIWAAAGGTAAAGFLGRTAEAARIHDDGLAVAIEHRTDLPWGVVELGYARCLAHLGSGDLGRAWTVADGGYRTAVEAQAPVAAAGWAAFVGLVAAAQGCLDEASRALREAVSILEDNDTFRFLRLCRAALAGVTALAGDAAGAATWMAAADGQAGGSNRLFGPWVERWRAWAAYASGATGEAVAAATRAAELGTMAALPTVEAAARYDIARLGAPTDLRRLDELAGIAGTPLAVAIAGAARALSTMDGEGLARAGAAFGALGQHLLAAEAVTAAACAYRQAGQRGTAALYRERAAALRARCPLARTRLLAPDDATAVLTPREREVVLLALRLTSKQIAGHLGLSLHTVNNNLARAYAKLGVSGRGELRALLADR
jgi:DNA-binding CsgD family transcriptional regulator